MFSKFEPKTLLFDFIMVLAFTVMGLFWFNVITFGGMILKVLAFAAVVLAISYFGVFRNHNYTKIACESQGKADIERGRIKSNTAVSEQTIDEEVKSLED